MRVLSLILPLFLIAGCTPPVQEVDIKAVAKECAQRARAAKGPTGQVTLGGSTSGGPFSKLSLGISSDFITGRDPEAVYKQCWIEKTGAGPTQIYAYETLND